ncbi:hypothetical protein BC826DRAFT_1024675, partial [Russula brevipes]
KIPRPHRRSCVWSYLLITVDAHSQAKHSCKRPQYIKTGLSPSPPPQAHFPQTCTPHYQ